MASKKKEERVLGPGAYGDIEHTDVEVVESYVLDSENHSVPASQLEHDTKHDAKHKDD